MKGTMIPKELQELINKLRHELMYMEGALDHINCCVDIKDERVIERDKPVNGASTMSSDLTDGINFVRQICEKYSTGNPGQRKE